MPIAVIPATLIEFHSHSRTGNGGGQDFGLAAAIATLIFLLVGALAIVNLKATRMKFD